MINLNNFISNFPTVIKIQNYNQPWDITNNIITLIEEIILNLDNNYTIENGIAIHKTATIEKSVVMKRPTIIMHDCFIGANSYFRAGVFLDESVKIGANCEIKSSIICSKTSISHLNYIGNSIIGQNVNFEAGSIAANHYNERRSKEIKVKFEQEIINTNSEKFGALVGDNSKIGANAVLSPGTILEKNSIVKRLQLIEQIIE